MLPIPYLRDNREAVIKGLRKKHFANAAEAVEGVLSLDQRRRDAQTQ